MSHTTPRDLLVLHTVRVMGYAPTTRIAARVCCTEAEATEHLLDAQAGGRIAWSSFAGDGGWSLTEAGKAHGEIRLAAELDQIGARAAVADVHEDFLPINDEVSAACTALQLTDMGVGERTVTVAETIARLDGPAAVLKDLEARLTARLHRFSGYHHRFSDALTAASMDPRWITGTDRDSCHRVWFELHEDLIATLGLDRQS